MNTKEFISVEVLSAHYGIDKSFFSQLDEFGLVEIHVIQQSSYIHQEKIGDMERMIRLYNELEINLEGIDTIFNLLEKIDQLQSELMEAKSKLRRYEE